MLLFGANNDNSKCHIPVFVYIKEQVWILAEELAFFLRDICLNPLQWQLFKLMTGFAFSTFLTLWPIAVDSVPEEAGLSRARSK